MVVLEVFWAMMEVLKVGGRMMVLGFFGGIGKFWGLFFGRRGEGKFLMVFKNDLKDFGDCCWFCGRFGDLQRLDEDSLLELEEGGKKNNKNNEPDTIEK